MALTTVGLTTHIQNNRLKSIFLLLSFPVLLCVMLFVFFSLTNIFLGSYHPETSLDWAHIWQSAQQSVFDFAPYVFLGVLIWFVIAWFYHGKIVRAATHSIPVSRKNMPRIYNLLENLCISRGITMPQFEIIDSPALNAFASGLTEANYKIVLTRGIIDALDDDELEGVIAHELTHIINKDVRLMMISIVFVGIISFALRFALQSHLFGRRGGAYYFSRSLRQQNRGRHAGGLIILIHFISLMIVLSLGYFFGLLIQFTLSQKREFLADAGAVSLTRNPDAMMRALMRISGRSQIVSVPKDVMQMCIENSYRSLFSSHPPIEQRISALSLATNAPVPTLQPTLRRPPRRPWGEPPSGSRQGKPWGVFQGRDT